MVKTQSVTLAKLLMSLTTFYLLNQKNLGSINDCDSEIAEMNLVVLQGFVLGPLLFLLYINELNQAIKFCTLHHFSDDTNLLYLGTSIKKLKKLVNINLKNLLNQLNAKKISLNVKKLNWQSLNYKKQLDDEI